MPVIRSTIITAEATANTDPTFGSVRRYYPAYVEWGDRTVPALFTRAQINTAIDRAKRNPEDIGPQQIACHVGEIAEPFPVEPRLSFWQRVCRWIAP